MKCESNSYARFGSVSEVMLTQQALELQTYLTVLTNKQTTGCLTKYVSLNFQSAPDMNLQVNMTKK